MKKTKDKLRVLSLFSGIGAFEKALNRLHIENEVVAYCEVNKYASTAYSAIHEIPTEKNLGDISKIDLSTLPDCDLVTYGFPCFVGGTLVLTNKGYKKIENVEIGDMVLTHNNRFREVLSIMDKESNEYYVIENAACEDIKVTKNHPFYVRERKLVDNKVNFSEPNWIAAGDLNTNHYLGLAINNEEREFDLKIFKFSELEEQILSKYVSMNSFWWLIGRWMACKVYENNVAVISTSESFISKMIKQQLDILKIKYTITKTNEKINFYIQDKVFNKITYYIKNDCTRFVESLVCVNPIYLRSFIVSYILENQYISSNGETILKLNDKHCAYSFAQIIAKTFKTIYRITKVDSSYYISFFHEDKYIEDAFYDEGYIWMPINNIYSKKEFNTVYNLEVEEDNSYTVYNIIAHNCQDISNAGKKKGIIKDETRSGLLYYALDVIEEKKPKYAICENVKNLVGKNFKKDFDNLLEILDKMGYNNYWKVINAKACGVPQNRERVFVVSIRKDLEKEYSFPNDILLDCKLNDLLEKDVDEKFYLSETAVKKLIRHKNKIISNDTPEISKCIQAGYYKIGGRDQQYIKIRKSFDFQQDIPLDKKLKDILEKEVDESFYVDQDRINILLKELLDKHCVAVREGTLKGYSEANEGDSVNINYPNSIIRRGRVGKEISNTLLTATQICVVEKNKKVEDNTTILEKRLVEYAEKNNEVPEFFNAYNRRTFDEVSPTITTTIGSPTSISGIVKCEGVESNNNVITYRVPKKVRVRVYDVDKDKLKSLLAEHRKTENISIRELSRRLNVPQTLVEHWFRGDDSFSIPHPEIWEQLKKELKITTTEYDKEIMTFEEKEGTYDKSNRIYDVEGNIPTLTTTCKEHTIVDLQNFRIRKLTPLETWKLMAFDPEDFFRAKEALIQTFYCNKKKDLELNNEYNAAKKELVSKYGGVYSEEYYKERALLINKYYGKKDKTNTQLYKMAGNSIVVNCLEGIFKNLL